MRAIEAGFPEESDVKLVNVKASSGKKASAASVQKYECLKQNTESTWLRHAMLCLC